MLRIHLWNTTRYNCVRNHWIHLKISDTIVFNSKLCFDMFGSSCIWVSFALYDLMRCEIWGSFVHMCDGFELRNNKGKDKAKTKNLLGPNTFKDRYEIARLYDRSWWCTTYYIWKGRRYGLVCFSRKKIVLSSIKVGLLAGFLYQDYYCTKRR